MAVDVTAKRGRYGPPTVISPSTTKEILVKSRYKPALTMLTGLATGALAHQRFYARSSPPKSENLGSGRVK
jgi:hypothetical protein